MRKTWNLKQGEQLKLEGMDLAAGNRKEQLDKARDVARTLAMTRVSRTLSIDDVLYVMHQLYNVSSLGPATGSVFKTAEWRFTGAWVKSKRVSNHGRMVRVWQYIGDQQ